VHARIAARDADYVVPGGESGTQFRDRVVAALDRLARAHPGASIAVVTHGGVLGVVYRWAKGIPLELPRTFAIPNGGVNRVRIERRRWSIDAWAETAHLPPGALDDE
jgi:probable phosphoglycerate mutase